jgi:hypothetical protein
MPEQVFRSPGYYDKEIDLSARVAQPLGVPYTLIGASKKGPAFVPRSYGSFDDFALVQGDLDPAYAAPYAAQKILDKNRAVVFLRVLGAGANRTTADIDTTRSTGIVKNAGMLVTGSATPDGRHAGAVQFLVAKHTVTGSEAYGYPTFTDNNSYTMAGNVVHLVRGMLMTAYDTRFMVLNGTGESFGNLVDDSAGLDNTSTSPTYQKFKLVLSSAAGSSFGTTDGFSGVKIMTASLNPSSTDYVGKILNTDPEKFAVEKHLFYADFAVDNELAAPVTVPNGVVLLSGSANTSATSGLGSLSYRDAFGYFNTRYTTPRTTSFISQPFGGTEHDLFHVEAIDDGEAATTKYKVSISSLRLNTDPRSAYGTFTLLVRDFSDSDFDMKVLEQYPNLSLDPLSENYIAKVIGDKKVSFNFDVDNEDDRRLILSGKYGNKSKYIRVVVSEGVENRQVPAQCLPFGFRGLPVLCTNSSLTDTNSILLGPRLGGSGSFDGRLSGSIVPPLPMRFKQTRGEVSNAPSFTGHPGYNETTDGRLFWGVKFERNTNVSNTNVSNEPNGLVKAYSKFQGLSKLDVLASGSFVDDYNNNKFTLARVALSATGTSGLTASVEQIIREAAYIRNGAFNANLSITDGAWGDRLTFGSLVSSGGYMDSVAMATFNRFSDYAKFTAMMYGGWDGVNIFSKDSRRFNDRSTSTESSSVGYGEAAIAYTSPGATPGVNYSGRGVDNNSVSSYRVAVDILSNRNVNNGNILAIPGIRDALVVDYTQDKVQREHQLCFYVADIPYYDYNSVRIFDGEASRFTDIEKTCDAFDALVVDKDASGVYFPNPVIDDLTNNRRVTVPASVAALGALAYNDKVAYPWWAPAGFNRASLDFVRLTSVRVTNPDRDRMYQSRINPITKFPQEGYVIYSQKTLKLGTSALDSINVKRMVLDVKRVVVDAALKTVWEQNVENTRNNFVSVTTSLMGTIQVKQGIERFKVICNDTNNTRNDAEENRLNGRIEFVPTRAVEFIAINFIVTRSGVEFV